MICTFKNTMNDGLSATDNTTLVFRNKEAGQTARVEIGLRGGCLHAGQITLTNKADGAMKIVETTNSFGGYNVGDASEYLSSLFDKHFA